MKKVNLPYSNQLREIKIIPYLVNQEQIVQIMVDCFIPQKPFYHHLK